jgi:hypothetical protein
MMNKMGQLALGGLLVSLLQITSVCICSAEVVEGQAAIIDGNIDKARFAARQDAMRNFVESKVGVHVSSHTQVDMGQVVADRILTNSNGYVQIKRVVKEEQQGGVYTVQLDLDASSQMFQTAAADLEGRLQQLEESSSRSGVSVAVSGRDEYGRPEAVELANNYVRSKMEDKGFRTVTNDAVLQYMSAHGDLSDPSTAVEIRKIARENRESENSLLRGTLSTTSVKVFGKYTEAMVNASFELIGLDNNMSNSFSAYVTAVGRNAAEAKKKAMDEAARQAVEALGQKALKTDQLENRGGVHHIKTSVVFQGITDRAGQSKQILAGLGSMNCRVIRYVFAPNGEFRVFLDAAGYETTADLTSEIQAHIQGLNPGVGSDTAVGSQKIYLSY